MNDELPDPWGTPIKLMRQGRQILGMLSFEAAIRNSGVAWDQELPGNATLQTVFGTYLGWCARLDHEPVVPVVLQDATTLDSLAQHAKAIIGDGRGGEALLAKVLPGYIRQASDPPAIQNTPNGPGFDRISVRHLVEDNWRELILYGRHLGENTRAPIGDLQPNLADFIRRLHERNEATAALMPPEQAKMYMEMINEEDTICSEEHQGDRNAFYRRLGLNLTDDRQRRGQPPAGYQRQGFGEMAARTAVRATIWESIYSLFRLLR